MSRRRCVNLPAVSATFYAFSVIEVGARVIVNVWCRLSARPGSA